MRTGGYVPGTGSDHASDARVEGADDAGNPAHRKCAATGSHDSSICRHVAGASGRRSATSIVTAKGSSEGCESRGDERRRGRGGGVDVGVETTRRNGDDGGSETGEGGWHGISVRVRVGVESRDGVGGRAEDERRELDVDDGDDVRASLRGAFVRVGIDGEVALAGEGDGDARVGGERAEGGLVDGQGVAGVGSGPLEGDGARALARHGTRRGRGVFGAVGERVGYRHRGRDGVFGRVLGRRGVRGGLVGSLRERRGRGVRVGRGRRGGDETSRRRPSGETGHSRISDFRRVKGEGNNDGRADARRGRTARSDAGSGLGSAVAMNETNSVAVPSIGGGSSGSADGASAASAIAAPNMGRERRVGEEVEIRAHVLGLAAGTRVPRGAARGRFAGGHSYTRSSGSPAVQPKVARARGETGRLASVAPGTSRPLSPSLASDASAAWSRARARRRARSTRARLVVRVSEQRGSIATRGVDPLVGPRRAHGGSPARARAPRAQRQ